MPPSEFDLDIDPSPDPETYEVSELMYELIQGIAESTDLQFRFWAAMSLAHGMSSHSPPEEAEFVVGYVVEDALDDNEPADGDYRLVLDGTGEITGVRDQDGDTDPPDDISRVVFEIVRLPDAKARQDALVELAQLAAAMQANPEIDQAIKSSRCWAAAQRMSTQ